MDQILLHHYCYAVAALTAVIGLTFLFCPNRRRCHGPRAHPIIGCLISFYQNKHRLIDWYTDLLSESPTSTIVINRLGARRTIVTANQDNVEYMLKTNFENYPKGAPFTDLLGDLLGAGIFNSDGEDWHKQRKLASHEFTTRSLRQNLVRTLECETKSRLLPILTEAWQSKMVVDVQDLLKRFTFDTICQISLGYDPGFLDPSLPKSKFANAFDVAAGISARRGAATVAAVWKLKRKLGIRSEKELKEKVGVIHKFVTSLIIRRMEEKRERIDFLSRLIAAGNDIDVIRDMVISFVMAGRDTSSAALTWFFYLIGTHPDVEKEVVKEVVEVSASGDDLDNSNVYQRLKEMRFLEACLMETIRLYPPVVWDSKHAAGNDVLPDGTTVGKGDRVTYFPYGMGRMEKIWGKNWSEFDPRRWLTNEGKEMVKVSPFKYPVFQAGPRVCLGKEMAFVQMKYVAAAVLRRFELRPVMEELPALLPLLTAHMSGGLRVMVKERGQIQSQ